MNSKITRSDGKVKGILFGDLFNIYNSISNKVNHCLLRFHLLLYQNFAVSRLLVS